MNVVLDVQKEIPVLHDIDVAVLGGGTAGTIAAIAAARLGAKTVVIERTGTLGGVPTTGLMGSMGNRLYDRKMNQLMGGLPREVVERLTAEGGTQFPDVEDTLKGKMGIPFTIPFQPPVLSYVLLKMAQEAGVRIMLHTHFSHLLNEGPRPKGFVVVNKSGQGAILAKAMVDASGEADLAAAAGAPCVNAGRTTSWGATTWGLLMRLGNVNFDKVIEMMKKLKPWEPWPEFGEWLSKQVGLSLEQLKQDPYWKHLLDPVPYGHAPMEDAEDRYYSPKKLQWILERWEKEGVFYNIELPLLRHKLKEAVDAADLSLIKKIEGFGEMRLNWDGFAGGAWGANVSLVNACHAMAGFDGTNGDHVSRAEVEGRIYNMEIARFLKKYVDGFENSYVIDMGWQFVPRHARMIEGEYIVSAEDVSGQGKDLPDTIYLFSGMNCPGKPNRIPYRALVPKRVDNIVVAGKCASGAHNFRSILSCMAMGQAAATAAVLMIRQEVANRDIEISLLQKMLKEQGVILDVAAE